MSGELLERRPERVVEGSLVRREIRVADITVFFTAVPADSEIIEGDAGLVHPYPDDRDVTEPELVVKNSRRRLSGEDARDSMSMSAEKKAESYVNAHPEEFSIDPSKL